MPQGGGGREYGLAQILKRPGRLAFPRPSLDGDLWPSSLRALELGSLWPCLVGWGGRGSTTVAFQGRESRALRESSRTTKLFTSALPPPPFLPYRTRPVSSSSVVQEQARRARLFPWQLQIAYFFVFRLYLILSIPSDFLVCFPHCKSKLWIIETHTEESAGSKNRAEKGLCPS